MDDHWLDPVFGDALNRSGKPRRTGLTMVLDKGLGPDQFDALLETAGEYIDQIKFPYGTAAFCGRELLVRKLNLSRRNDVLVYPGGTLFEVAHQAMGTLEYFNALREMGFPAVEISSGSIDLAPQRRRELIRMAVERDLTVLSEVGKKDPNQQPDPIQMARQVNRDFKSGSRYVTIESRESGKGIGIYDDAGQVVEDRVDRLLEHVDRTDHLIWEAPLTNQQGYLIRRFGREVNLGNIPPTDVLALESLRWGLRWETVNQQSPFSLAGPVET